jgi:hypothetical protein
VDEIDAANFYTKRMVNFCIGGHAKWNSYTDFEMFGHLVKVNVRLWDNASCCWFVSLE